MRKLFTLLTALAFSILAITQTPSKMSYQAVIRNPNNVLVTNSNIGMQVSILQASVTGSAVYVERHFPTTNSNGLVTIEIGGGLLVSGNFTTIDWSTGLYFLKTEIDLNGGANYTISGSSQLLSVPYALYAATSSDAVKTTGDQTINGVKTFSNDLLIKELTVGKGRGFAFANTAIGYLVLSSNTSGSNNTANGYYALTSNTSGSDNAAIGNYSLFDNITGGANTSVGSFSLENNTSGGANTASGMYSLRYNTIGQYNSANGATALSDNTAGNYNTADGYGSMHTNTTGSYNTAIGASTGLANLTGSYNTSIGYHANMGSDNLTNSTSIGNNAIVNASNKVRIGNTAVTVIEGQVAFTSASDLRLKRNIKDLSSGLDFITKLRPVEYQLKQGDDRINFGFIAQDIELLFGTNNNLLTIGGDADRTLGLRYTDFIAPIVKAIQEQQKQIQEQRKEIDELKQFVKAITKK